MNLSHRSKTGSIDIGLMQINSRWLYTHPFKDMGYTADSLRDTCTNIKVAAWILGGLLRTHANFWDAVGAYNASCATLHGSDCERARDIYAWKVYRVWRQS